MCDLLDRKLFETSVAADVTALAATTHGFEHTVAGVLDVLKRFVDYDLASVLLLEERASTSPSRSETSQAHYARVPRGSRGRRGCGVQRRTRSLSADLDVRLADPDELLGEDDEARMSTFLSMPLRGSRRPRGRCAGAVERHQERVRRDRAATLRLIEGPAAIVIDNARLAEVRAGLTVPAGLVT